jgi:uncharacterized protein YigA (DUF484 family)
MTTPPGTATSGETPPPQGITEQDIAEYLVHTPGFFERHAELLGAIQLTSPHGHRAVSLQERQMEMLRERIKGLEMKIIEMIRHGQENMAMSERLHQWTRTILTTENLAELPGRVVAELKHQFLIPQGALRLWDLDDAYAQEDFAQGVSEDVRILAASQGGPYCGPGAGFEASSWLKASAEGMPTASIAMVPLRQATAGASVATFGLLVLGSPDPMRYGAEMGTEFLTRVGEIASAGLSRLRRVPA